MVERGGEVVVEASCVESYGFTHVLAASLRHEEQGRRAAHRAGQWALACRLPK